MQEEQFFWVFVVCSFAGAVLAAYLHGDKWYKDKGLSKLSFTWGYFVIYSTFLGNTLIFGAAFVAGIDNQDGGLVILGLVGFMAVASVTYFALNRYKWALVLSTLLSLNALYIVVNFFYLKNRWREFSEEQEFRNGNVGEDSSNSKEIVGVKLPKDLRVAIFVAACWLVLVPVFVFVVKPYGRHMRDDDIIHMLGSMFIPMVAGLGLYFLYRKFIK